MWTELFLFSNGFDCARENTIAFSRCFICESRKYSRVPAARSFPNVSRALMREDRGKTLRDSAIRILIKKIYLVAALPSIGFQWFRYDLISSSRAKKTLSSSYLYNDATSYMINWTAPSRFVKEYRAKYWDFALRYLFKSVSNQRCIKILTPAFDKSVRCLARCVRKWINWKEMAETLKVFYWNGKRRWRARFSIQRLLKKRH